MSRRNRDEEFAPGDHGMRGGSTVDLCPAPREKRCSANPSRFVSLAKSRAMLYFILFLQAYN